MLGDYLEKDLMIEMARGDETHKFTENKMGKHDHTSIELLRPLLRANDILASD